jgi:hypothetical protein
MMVPIFGLSSSVCSFNVFDGQTVGSGATVRRCSCCHKSKKFIVPTLGRRVEIIEMLLTELMGGVAMGNSNVDVYY